VLVSFRRDNRYDLLGWMDGTPTGRPRHAAAGYDFELPAHRLHPIAGTLQSAGTYLQGVIADDPAATCRPYRVVLVTDGL